MGLIFLRHAYSRYLAVKDEIEAGLPKRGGKAPALTKEDFARKSAIFLRPEAQFDYLVALPDSADRAQAIVEAMESIEEDYEGVKGVLPKTEYQELDKPVLRDLLRTFNDPALKQADGDVFGRIYEYFLTRFADLKAHDNGEFFTPVSLVQMIVNVIEPEEGTVLDPACGSGGMFVQSAHFIERMHKNPTEEVTFYGMEKNPTTIRLAKMNLAVHGLEGDIRKAITYYEDPHELLGKADFLMANPPFNVDEIDADSIKNDPRFPFGLPGVNKKKKVSNGNYVWISCFYSYLNDHGRSGFVMSSQASSAGRDEAKVRQRLIETGHVDVMMAIRSNFFYTRTVPCELWFFDKAKPEDKPDKVLMIDARNIYRKVTRKINDFSPEQLKNLSSIVWLYRGEKDRFLDLVANYLGQTLQEARACFARKKEGGSTVNALTDYKTALSILNKAVQPFLDTVPQEGPHVEILRQLEEAIKTFEQDMNGFITTTKAEAAQWDIQALDNAALNEATRRLAPLADTSRDLIKQADLLYKRACRLIEVCEGELGAKQNDLWINREITKARKAADEARQVTANQLKRVRYFHKQAVWLTERFPNAKLCDVEGLVKLVDRAELETNDWSLTPGRYVGVAPEEEDEDFDFEETIRTIHVELEDLNRNATELAVKIARNFERLRV